VSPVELIELLLKVTIGMSCQFDPRVHTRFKELNPRRMVYVEIEPRPSALRKRVMHFPFEILIWEPRYFRIVSPKIK
jgi:hypothetical protein